jgi:hypothetical protein
MDTDQLRSLLLLDRNAVIDEEWDSSVISPLVDWEDLKPLP